MNKLTEDSLFSLLNQKGLKPEIEEKSRQIYVTMRIQLLDVPIFCGLRGEGTLFQTIAYLPYEIKEKAIGDIARLLHLLNKECDIPGFGMDEKRKILFFRCVAPSTDGVLDPRLVDLFLVTTRLACETFMEAISMIASGKTTVDDIWKEMRRKS